MDQLTFLRNRYLNLLIESLTGVLTKDPNIDYWRPHEWNPLLRYLGQDAPDRSLTMIGTVRMRHLRQCCESVLMDNIPGDFIETGVWRGGACILMRAILAAYEDPFRRVFVADSFQGIPPPNPDKYPADYGLKHHEVEYVKITQQEVEENFRKYGLLDDRVVFLKGWFKDTLPQAVAPPLELQSGSPRYINNPTLDFLPGVIKKLAILRLDGDLYESTIQTLENLYPRVSDGGYVIIDDLNLKECVKAVNDYRTEHNIKDPCMLLDGCSGWWRVGTG